MGQEYLFLIVNELLHFEKLLIFSEKKPFTLLFYFLFVDLGFSFLPLKYFIHFKRRNFCSGIVANVYTVEKAHFPSFTNFFSICRVSTFKVYAEAKSFTDYSLIIVAEIYMIFRSELIRQMNSGPYSLGTDGSNDESGIKKLNPVLLHLFDYNKGKVSVQLLDMGACKEGTIQALFNNINSTLRENRVNWETCVVVGLENTAVNVGKTNSIMTRVLAKNKNIFINGCPCNIIHNTVNKAAERFSEVSRFDDKDFLVDLFHWFDKSSKRKDTSNFQL